MVNVGFSWGSLIGIILAVAGAALYFIRSYKPGLARDYDIFFAAVGLLCGGILFFNSWRLDPILQFSQFLLAGSAIFFAYESIRLRNVTTEQAKRTAPLVDDDRPVSRVYRAELDDMEPIERQPYNRRIRGSDDSRDSRAAEEYGKEYGSRSRDGREVRDSRDSRDGGYDAPPRRRPPTQRPPRDDRDSFGGPSAGASPDGGGVPRKRRPAQRPPNRPETGADWSEPPVSRSSRRPAADSTRVDSTRVDPTRSEESWGEDRWEQPDRSPRSRRDRPSGPEDRAPTRKRRSGTAPLADEPPVSRTNYVDEPPARKSSYSDGYAAEVEPADSYVSYQPIDPEPTEEDWDRYADQASSRPPLDLSPKDEEGDGSLGSSRDSEARFSDGNGSDRYEDDFDRPVKFER